MGEEIGAGTASPLTVVLPTKPCKTAMPGVGGGGGGGYLGYSQTRSSVPVANKLMNSLMQK